MGERLKFDEHVTELLVQQLADVRRIALSLPETTEKERWGHPTFDVARKMFVTVPDDETSFAVRCHRFDREELIAAETHKFWVPRHEAASAWVRVRLAALDDVATRHHSTPTAVALAWLASKPPISGVIVSARNTAQLSDVLASADLRLGEADITRLDEASA